MKLVEINRHPNDRQLKQFATATVFFLPWIGWLASGKPRTVAAANLTLLSGLFAVGLAVALVGLIKPKVLQPVFIGMSLVTLPIGLMAGEAVLLVIFYGVFTPIGLLFRLIGRDALQRRSDHGAKSYWQPKRQPDNAARYYRQF